MGNLLTQTVGKYVRNRNSQGHSHEGKIPSKFEAMHTLWTWQFHLWSSILEKPWYIHTRTV